MSITLTTTPPPPPHGREQITYQEFARLLYSDVPLSFRIAVDKLQKKHGEFLERKLLTYCLYAATYGTALLPNKTLLLSARRIRGRYGRLPSSLIAPDLPFPPHADVASHGLTDCAGMVGQLGSGIRNPSL